MVGPPYDCLANPLGAVRLTFEKAVALGSDPASFDGKDWGALDLFRQFLFDQGGLSHVPVLNPTTMKWVQPNSLVRFRGMVQDMLGNEFYVGAYKDGSVWRTNKFMDFSQYPMSSSPDMRVWERRLLYCIPVPGQNSWTEPSSEVVINGCLDLTSQQREKRLRMDDDASDHMDLVSDDGFQSSPSAKKMRETGLASQSSLSKDSKVGAISTTSSVPVVDRNSLPCLVKIYDFPENELKLNDVFEFVGVLTLNSDVSVDKDDQDEFSNGFFEDEFVHSPSAKVPHLHCLIHRKLDIHDFLRRSRIMEPKPHLVKEIRESLMRHLTVILGNDGISAHFMLLHLLSKVHARADNFAVGKLSLNLTCLSKEDVSVFGNHLRLAFQNILPFTHYIPLTVEYLNTASLAPKKDYQTNRLTYGVLQLAEGSHLIIDETQLEAGTLNSTGVENARLLKNLMEFQKVSTEAKANAAFKGQKLYNLEWNFESAASYTTWVEYNFEYYKMEMTADVQLLVFSEGKSNIVPADLVMPFQPSSSSCFEVVPTETIEAWRWYLATVRSLPHSIESEMQKVVENDLVAARQGDRSLSSQDLSRLVTMGRLMSASFGETKLSLEHWQMVKELERLRTERLK